MMPFARKSRKAVFRWLRRALALRCCVVANCAATASACFREHRPPRYQIATRRQVAVRTWQTVTSRFFPPLGQAELGQEQVAHAGQHQMARYLRTSKWSMPSSLLESSNIRSMRQRLKATSNNTSSDVFIGALLRKYLTSSG